jgi:flavin reductase (DIM6/NTAB) family NADH-FMN oxidoreductase RutF
MKELDINKFVLSPEDFKKGFLVTSGDLSKYNTMTAGWGSIGEFWSKPAITIYIRDTRYTYEFTNENDYFTCSFYSDEYKEMLKICGSKSGREVDKAKLCNLTPTKIGETVSFEEAKITLLCKKMCHFDVKEADFDNTALGKKVYPLKDYHRGYIAEIVKIIENN